MKKGKERLLNPTSILVHDTLKVLLPINFRPLQKEYLENKERFNILVAHRRFGKSVCLLFDLVLSMITCKKKNPKFAYIAPTLEQGVKIAWQYMKDICSSFPNTTISESNYTIKMNFGDGCGVRTLAIEGANNGSTSIRGTYLDGVVIDEMGSMNRGVWELDVRPALSDRKGWATITGTPMLGYWQEMFENAKETGSFKIFDYSDARKTGIMSEEELRSARLTSDSEASFRREYYGDWVSPDIGCYYSENLFNMEESGHISTKHQYDPNLPVFTSWDLGTNDWTVVWFGQYDKTTDITKFFNYYQVRGITNSLEVLAKVEKLGYPIDLLVLPHDSKHRFSNSIASTYELFKRKYPVIVVNKSPSKLQDIQIIKNNMHNIRINSEMCSRGLLELHKYRSTLNKKTDILSTTPMHNDAADSFRYAIMGLFQERHRYCEFKINYRPFKIVQNKVDDLI